MHKLKNPIYAHYQLFCVPIQISVGVLKENDFSFSFLFTGFARLLSEGKSRTICFQSYDETNWKWTSISSYLVTVSMQQWKCSLLYSFLHKYDTYVYMWIRLSYSYISHLFWWYGILLLFMLLCASVSSNRIKIISYNHLTQQNLKTYYWKRKLIWIQYIFFILTCSYLFLFSFARERIFLGNLWSVPRSISLHNPWKCDLDDITSQFSIVLWPSHWLRE